LENKGGYRVGHKRKIVLLDVNYPDNKQEQKVLEGLNVEFVVVDQTATESELLSHLSSASAVMVREYPVTEALVNEMEHCKVIVRYGVGVDNIDLQAAKQKGIYVVNVPDYGSEEVSDHALSLLLTVSRRIVSRNYDVRQGKWNIGPDEKIYSFRGKTLGVLGYGRIGRRFVEKARVFGFSKVLVFDPYMNGKPQDAELCGLDELCVQSDVISLHMPLTNDNYHILNKEKMELLKKNCILVNTSRGGLIDEEALFDLLNKNEIFGAGLDVFEKEAPDVKAPLFTLRNVVMTDHMGWYSEESLQDLQRKAAEEVLRVLTGEAPKNCVNGLIEVKQ
jgi:D-3-phosphoglycerate dehydrogenase